MSRVPEITLDMNARQPDVELLEHYAVRQADGAKQLGFSEFKEANVRAVENDAGSINIAPTHPLFDCVFDHGTWKSWGVTYIIDMRKNIRQYAGPDHWNDPDMMEVGHGMSASEDRAHFSMWCMLAAPLIAGNDLRDMSKETIATLTDKEAIAIDQDSLGIQGYLYQQKDSVDTWIKPLANNEVAICFMNRSKNPVAVSYDFNQHPVIDTFSKANINFIASPHSIRDVWMKKEIGDTKKPLAVTVQPHDVVLLRLSVFKQLPNKKTKK